MSNATLPSGPAAAQGDSASNTTGAVIAIIASFLSILGTNTQKNSHLKEKKLPEVRQRIYWRRPQWWVGFSLVVLGAIGDFVALGFASQAMVSALGGGTTLIGNVLIAKKWNKELLFKTDLVGLGFVLLGAQTFALTTPPSQNWTLEQLRERFVSAEFLAYAATNVAVGCILLGTIASSSFYAWRAQATFSAMAPLVQKVDAMMEAQTEWIANLEARIEEIEAADPTLSGGADAGGGVGRSARLPRHVQVPPGGHSLGGTHYAHALLQQRLAEIESVRGGGNAGHWADQYVYAACAGSIGAMSVLFASCVAKLLLESLSGNNQFSLVDPMPYVFIALMLCTITLQTHFLNAALMMGDAMSVFPVFQVFWMGFSVIGGVVFYQTGAVSAWGLLFFVFGVAFLVQHGKRSDKLANKFGGASAGARHVRNDAAEVDDGRDFQMGERPLLEQHPLSDDEDEHGALNDETII